MSRTISGTSLTALTADNSTMWFSVMMNPRTADSEASFALNSYGTIVLGDAALTGGSGSAAAPIASGGNAIGVGFAGTGGGGVWDDMRIQGVTYSGGALTESSRTTVGDTTLMIVGKVDWAANGSDDTISLYNVTDPSAALPAAFSTMTVDLDQSTFSVVSIGDAQTSIFDEIRMDTELANVIPEPATLGLVAAFGGAVLFIRRRFMR
jgi:hypothetical protein